MLTQKKKTQRVLSPLMQAHAQLKNAISFQIIAVEFQDSSLHDYLSPDQIYR